MEIALLLVPGVPVLMILFLLAIERVEAGLSEPGAPAVRPARGSGSTRPVDGPSVKLGEGRRDQEAFAARGLVDEDVGIADVRLSG